MVTQLFLLGRPYQFTNCLSWLLYSADLGGAGTVAGDVEALKVIKNSVDMNSLRRDHVLFSRSLQLCLRRAFHLRIEMRWRQSHRSHKFYMLLYMYVENEVKN